MAGRPNREFTEEQTQEIIKLALAGCQTNTIASITGIPEKTLRSNFAELMTQKRAERKYNLRSAQTKAAKKGSATMLMFLGKNELEQNDKHDLAVEGSVTVNIVDYAKAAP